MAEPAIDALDFSDAPDSSDAPEAFERPAVERAQDFPGITTDELWAAVTEAEQLEAWLGEQVELDLRPNGRGRVVDGDEVRQVLIDAIEPGRRLAFRWWPPTDAPAGRAPDHAGEVTFVIADIDGGSRLIVRETRPVAGADWGVALALLGFGLHALARC